MLIKNLQFSGIMNKQSVKIFARSIPASYSKKVLLDDILILVFEMLDNESLKKAVLVCKR